MTRSGPKGTSGSASHEDHVHPAAGGSGTLSTVEEVDDGLPGAGAWEVEGEAGYVDPATAADEWQAADARSGSPIRTHR